MTAGEQLGLDLRDAGHELALANADSWWRSCVDEAVEHLASQRAPFTSDDVRELVTLEPRSPSAWGAAIAAHVKAGRLQYLGHRRSTRPESRARAVAVWVGVGVADERGGAS